METLSAVKIGKWGLYHLVAGGQGCCVEKLNLQWFSLYDVRIFGSSSTWRVHAGYTRIYSVTRLTTSQGHLLYCWRAPLEIVSLCWLELCLLEQVFCGWAINRFLSLHGGVYRELPCESLQLSHPSLASRYAWVLASPLHVCSSHVMVNFLMADAKSYSPCFVALLLVQLI